MRTTCSFASPLSSKQKTIWGLASRGTPIAAIAEKLKTSRQYVNQTRLAAEAKISRALLDVAQVNELQVIRLNAKDAILLGYQPFLKQKAIVTYTTRHGMKVWYWHEHPEEITDQEFLKQTREYLLEIAGERGMQLEISENLHPAALAKEIFSKLLPGLTR